MAKLRSYRRIVTSDYEKEDQPLVEKIADPLNDAFNELYYTLNGRVDLTNNIFGSVRLVDVTVNANGIPVNRTTFGLNNTQPVIGCIVLQALNQTNTAVYPTGAPFISFTQIDQAILINHITGLQPNQRYTLRIVAFN
jgi:hypothetical protein